MALSEIKLKVELPTTSDLFKKHFNEYGQAGLFHPNVVSFFEELNTVCRIEDALKVITQNPSTNG